jgi:hypothetical protein
VRAMADARLSASNSKQIKLIESNSTFYKFRAFARDKGERERHEKKSGGHEEIDAIW